MLRKILLGLVIFSYTSQAQAWFGSWFSGREQVTHEERSFFPFSKNGSISLHTHCPVTVIGHDLTHVEMIVVREGDSLDFVKAQVEQTFYSTRSFSLSTNCDTCSGVTMRIILKIPHAISVNFRSAYGSQGGDYFFTDLSGELEVEVKEGNLHFKDCSTIAKALTLNGAIVCESDLLGGVVSSLHTQKGSLSVACDHIMATHFSCTAVEGAVSCSAKQLSGNSISLKAGCGTVVFAAPNLSVTKKQSNVLEGTADGVSFFLYSGIGAICAADIQQ